MVLLYGFAASLLGAYLPASRGHTHWQQPTLQVLRILLAVIVVKIGEIHPQTTVMQEVLA